MILNRLLFPFSFFILALHLAHSSQAFWPQKTTSNPKYKIKKIHFITKNKALSSYLEKKRRNRI